MKALVVLCVAYWLASAAALALTAEWTWVASALGWQAASLFGASIVDKPSRMTKEP